MYSRYISVTYALNRRLSLSFDLTLPSPRSGRALNHTVHHPVIVTQYNSAADQK